MIKIVSLNLAENCDFFVKYVKKCKNCHFCKKFNEVLAEFLVVIAEDWQN